MTFNQSVLRLPVAVVAAILAALAGPARAQSHEEHAVQLQLARIDAAAKTGAFRANWDSLAAYRVPDWFRDAKLGIFVHWGPYSVPAFGNEWYARNMYQPGKPEFEHHRGTYGPQNEFGYKDLIPLLTGE